MAIAHDAKELILGAVGKEAEPIYKVAEKANVSVQTASKYLYVLEAEGRIKMEKFGNMQLVRRAK